MTQGILLFDSLVAVIALLVGFFLYKFVVDRRRGDAQQTARGIVEAAEREAETRRRVAELELKENELKSRTELEQQARRREAEIEAVERRMLTKEEQVARKLEELDRRLDDYTTKDRGLVTREKAMSDKEARLAVAVDEQRRKLEVIAGLTAEEAKRQLIGQMESEARREAALIGMRL